MTLYNHLLITIVYDLGEAGNVMSSDDIPLDYSEGSRTCKVSCNFCLHKLYKATL